MEKIEWFKKNVKYFKIRKIEIELSIPIGTLDKYIRGDRRLSDDNTKKLLEWIDCLNVFNNKEVIKKGEISSVNVEKVKKVKKEKNEKQTETVENNNIDSVRWSFFGLPDVERVEGNIFTDGNKFVVRKYFGSIEKFAIVDNMETARLLSE
jgi:hypothetical protein